MVFAVRTNEILNLPSFSLQIDEEADEEAKSMDLNKVVLRFQAFQYDKSIEAYRPITLPVDSDIVYNLSESTVCYFYLHFVIFSRP